MMRRIIITSAALLSFAPWVFSQVTCDSFDYGNTAFWNSSAFPGTTTEHTTGNHIGYTTQENQCTYSQGAGTTCNPYCSSYSDAVDTYDVETGTLNTLLDKHYLGIQWSGGTATSNGPSVSCGTTIAFSTLSCTFSCTVSISFSATASGVGTTVTFPSKSLVAASNQATITCAPANSRSGAVAVAVVAAAARSSSTRRARATS